MKKTLKIIGCVILATIFCFSQFKVLAKEENTLSNGGVKSSEVSDIEVQKEEKMTDVSEETSELSEDEKKENLEENKETQNSLVLRSSVSNQYEVGSENNEKVEEQVVLEDGEYRIKSEKNHDRYIGIENGSNKNEAKLVLQDYTAEENIIFKVQLDSDGFYTIESKNSSKVVDVPGASKSMETKLHQYESNGTDAQKWRIIKDSNGSYNLISKCNDLYWDLPGASTSEGTKIQLYEGNNTVAQQFLLEKVEHIKGERTLEDGEYKIKLCKDSSKYVGIENESTSNEAKVVVKKSDGDIFNVEYISNGYYKLEVKKSKKVIDVPGASKTMTTQIHQYAYNGTDAQKWIIKDLGNEKFCIISKCNDLCWDLPGANTDVGTRIQMYSMNSTIAQEFKFEKVEQQESTASIESGIYKIKSAKDTSKVFGIVNASKENCAKLILTDDVDGNYQKFYISDVGKGYYEIKLVHSNKALDVPGASGNLEIKIQQYSPNGTDAQKWIIKANENGTCSIVSKCNDLYLDLPGGSVNVGNEVQTYSGNGTLAQQFIIEKTEPRAIEEGVYEIETSLGNDMVLDISGGSTSNNANVQLWKKDNVLQQKFKISYVKGGYYKIEAIHSKKALDIDSNGTNVVQYDSGDKDSQQWSIVDSGNGTYSIISKSTGKYLNIQDEVADYRANVNVSSKNNKSSQKFKLKSTNVGELRGIDVSSHQGSINWEAVKNSGIDFVILRCGYGENLTSQDDTRFVSNMLECERLGIDYGVYLYSYALNENGAVSEANHVLRLIKGHNVKYGVWFDMEDADGYKERKGMPSDATLVNICKVFCDTIRANGYDAGIYASYYWLVTSLNSSKLDEYDKWVAQWSSRCSYTKPYKMWQYSSSGTVNGISGSVDMNIMYR